MPFDIVKRRLSGAWTVAWQRITIGDEIIGHSVGSGTATAGYRVNTSGIAEKRDGASYTTLETWLSFGSASSYEVRATVTSGAVTSGTTGSWLALSSSQEWLVQRGTVGISNAVLTIEIRNATSLVVVDSADVDLEAERF